jgi:hypothetical protein
MHHAILNKHKLVGLFSDYQKCKIMIEGLISNNFAERKNLEIKSYYINSITVGEYKEDMDDTETNSNINNILEEFTDNNTTDTDNYIKNNTNNDIPIDTKKQNDIKNEIDTKKQNDIKNEINELKKKKEKLEEKKRVYEVDLDLYNKFKNILETNKNFTIPEMFIDKYTLMEVLEKENKLCWENFNELYIQKNMTTNYDKLFN